MWFFKRKSKSSSTGNPVLDELIKQHGSSITDPKRLSAVFSCIRVISESIGMLPLSHYQKKDGKRSKLDDDLYRVIAIEPNQWMTAQEFWEMCGVFLGNKGNFYAYINRVGNTVEELLPITGTVKKKQSKNFEVWYEVLVDGKVFNVPENSILHIPLMTLDGLVGISPIDYAKNTFNFAVGADRLGSSYFENAARPGGVLGTDKNLTTDQMKEYQKAWDERQGGSDNFRTAIIGNGFKYYPTAISASDIQFLESRKMTRSEICGIFRVPPHMIGDLEKATFSNIEQQGQDFVTHCLMPYLTRIENRIRKTLIPKNKRSTEYVKFNVGALVRGDMAARGAFYQTMVQNGALSPNGIRELEDMEPREGGDIYLTPMNMYINGHKPEGA